MGPHGSTVAGGSVARLWHVEELEFSLGQQGPYGGEDCASHAPPFQHASQCDLETHWCYLLSACAVPSFQQICKNARDPRSSLSCLF